jgi:hypothetical protein
MSLSLIATKESETEEACVYAVGLADTPAGRIRLHKSSGDLSILERPAAPDGTGPQFLLAQAVSRLQGYHDRDSYPERDRWTV